MCQHPFIPHDSSAAEIAAAVATAVLDNKTAALLKLLLLSQLLLDRQAATVCSQPIALHCQCGAVNGGVWGEQQLLLLLLLLLLRHPPQQACPALCQLIALPPALYALRQGHKQRPEPAAGHNTAQTARRGHGFGAMPLLSWRTCLHVIYSCSCGLTAYCMVHLCSTSEHAQMPK
jgi:hypothetical protein